MNIVEAEKDITSPAGEKRMVVDPRLRGVCKIVVHRTWDLIEPELKTAGLLNADGEPCQPLTTGGLELLLRNTVTAIKLALSQADLSTISPGCAIEELTLADNMARSSRPVKVNQAAGNLIVEFGGEGSLIRRIETPLDVDLAISKRLNPDDSIGKVDLGKKILIKGTGLLDKQGNVIPWKDISLNPVNKISD